MQASHRVEKPWGWEIWWANTDSYAGKLLHIEAGHRLSLQYHREKDESCFVLSGLVRVLKGPSADALVATDKGPGGCWRNQPGEIHTIEALETSLVAEASTPHLDDVVRLLDDYGRAEGKGCHLDARTIATASPVRLIDRDQLAAKLSLTRIDVMKHVEDPAFPPEAGYFRGRTLWEEASVDAWLRTSAEPSDVASAALRA